MALIMSQIDTGHIFDFLIGLMGLIGGPLAGLFLLAIFAHQAKKHHAWFGLICSLIAIFYCQYLTDLNGLLYGLVGVGVCFSVGYALSFLPQKTNLN